MNLLHQTCSSVEVVFNKKIYQEFVIYLQYDNPRLYKEHGILNNILKHLLCRGFIL